jgi:hypothetical protein
MRVTGAFEIDSKARDRLKRIWEVNGVARMSTLKKYEIALATVGVSPIDKGRSPAQDVSNLASLRNHLIHFSPKWRQPGRNESWERALERSFVPSSLAGDNADFFPSRCLGHGCAHWAIVKSRAFVDEFARKIGFQGIVWYITHPDPLPSLASPFSR